MAVNDDAVRRRPLENASRLTHCRLRFRSRRTRRTIMPTFRGSTRREVLATGAATIVTSLLPRQRATAAETSSGGAPIGPGSVLGAPSLPAGFANTFSSRYVDANGVRLHAVIGGKGRPLLLVHGW